MTQCNLIIILLMIVYTGPIVFDIFPSSDSYLGGIGFLGIWGTVFATILAIVLSMLYGYNCVSEKTVYRCAGWGCDENAAGLVFTDKFPNELKNIYINKLSNLPRGILSHLPKSKFNKELVKLNKTFLY